MRRAYLHLGKFPRTIVAVEVTVEGLQGADSTNQINVSLRDAIFVEARVSPNLFFWMLLSGQEN